MKINEVSSVPKEKEIIVREERRVADEETEERLRQTIHENARMREEIEELEAANRNLYRERRKSVIPTVFQVRSLRLSFSHTISLFTDWNTDRRRRPFYRNLFSCTTKRNYYSYSRRN